ncbi:hypothetical protein C8F01DRAFT_1087078 [Mycena amicta]|nr:hypothetical protein C8F01DRAFT_1087078 [Mycena amicta]
MQTHRGNQTCLSSDQLTKHANIGAFFSGMSNLNRVICCSIGERISAGGQDWTTPPTKECSSEVQPHVLRRGLASYLLAMLTNNPPSSTQTNSESELAQVAIRIPENRSNKEELAPRDSETLPRLESAVEDSTRNACRTNSQTQRRQASISGVKQTTRILHPWRSESICIYVPNARVSSSRWFRDQLVVSLEVETSHGIVLTWNPSLGADTDEGKQKLLGREILLLGGTAVVRLFGSTPSTYTHGREERMSDSVIEWTSGQTLRFDEAVAGNYSYPVAISWGCWALVMKRKEFLYRKAGLLVSAELVVKDLRWPSTAARIASVASGTPAPPARDEHKDAALW